VALFVLENLQGCTRPLKI